MNPLFFVVDQKFPNTPYPRYNPSDDINQQIITLQAFKMSAQLHKVLLSYRNLLFKDGRSVSFEQKLRLKSQGFRSRKITLCASGIEELVQGEALQEAIRIHPVPEDFQFSFARSPRFKKISRTLLTTKSTLSTTYPTSITACTHSFHEIM